MPTRARPMAAGTHQCPQYILLGLCCPGRGNPQPAHMQKKNPKFLARKRKVKRITRRTERLREKKGKEKKKSLLVEGKREKEKVEMLTMQISSIQKKPFTIAQGKKQKLCEIKRIHFFLSKKKMDELRNLHKLLYNRPLTVSSLKKNLGQFSGFPFEK